MPAKIIDFSAILKKKQDREMLKERISVSGWTITDEVLATNSDACVYLMDSQEEGVLLFGCKRSDFSEPNSNNIITWKDFVLAWDVIADPEMAFDETHKQNTMKFSLRALPSLEQWIPFTEKAFDMKPNLKVHIFVIIDRMNLEAPLILIAAHSDTPVMNRESINAIVDTYLDSQ